MSKRDKNKRDKEYVVIRSSDDAHPCDAFVTPFPIQGGAKHPTTPLHPNMTDVEGLVRSLVTIDLYYDDR